VGGGRGSDGAAEIPDDWQNLTAVERKALAKAISGEPAPNVREADLVIAAEIERRAAEAGSGDNAPTRASGNGLQEALGVQPPDWVAPAAS
jgi:hypothetical protein